MKKFSFFPMILLLAFPSLLLAVEEKGEGELELRYEAKQCITTPCPQFEVLSVNGTKVSDLGADIVNTDPRVLSLRLFQTVEVKGTWVKEDNYLKVDLDKASVVLLKKNKK